MCSKISSQQNHHQNHHQLQFLIVPPSDPLQPSTTIIVGACKYGLPCKHCLSLDNGKTFKSEYGHDIYNLLKERISSKDKFYNHLRGMYEANALIKYRPIKILSHTQSSDSS